MSKHTPGPWHANPYVHASVHGFAVYADRICMDKLADEIQSEANARLIAAAPELLEALKQAVNLLETEVRPAWEQTHFRKIIAKAEGER